MLGNRNVFAATGAATSVLCGGQLIKHSGHEIANGHASKLYCDHAVLGQSKIPSCPLGLVVDPMIHMISKTKDTAGGP